MCSQRNPSAGSLSRNRFSRAFGRETPMKQRLCLVSQFLQFSCPKATEMFSQRCCNKVNLHSCLQAASIPVLTQGTHLLEACPIADCPEPCSGNSDEAKPSCCLFSFYNSAVSERQLCSCFPNAAELERTYFPCLHAISTHLLTQEPACWKPFA